MADVDHDGKPDFVAIAEFNTGTGAVEVHAVSGASNFQNSIDDVGTAFGATPNPSNFSFAMGWVSPTVSVTNLTHPDLTPNFLAGDTYQYVIFGSPGLPVYAVNNATDRQYLGQTDPSGHLVVSGVEQTAWIGTYTQVWSVGNQQASPALTFLVGQVGGQGTLTATSIATTPDSSILGISSISIANGSATTYSATEESYNASLYYDVQTVATLFDNGNVAQQASDQQNGSAGGYLSGSATNWHQYSLQTDHYAVAYWVYGDYFQNPFYFQSGSCDESGDCTYGPGGGILYIASASIYLGSTFAEQVAVTQDGSIPFNDETNNILPEKTPPPGGWGMVINKWDAALAAAWTVTLARQALSPPVTLPFILLTVGDCQDRNQNVQPPGLAERTRIYRVLDGQGRPWSDAVPLLVKENVVTWTNSGDVFGNGNWSTNSYHPQANEQIISGVFLDQLRGQIGTTQGAYQQFYAQGFPMSGFSYPAIPGYSGNTVPLLIVDTLGDKKGIFGTLANEYRPTYISINGDGGNSPNIRKATDRGISIPTTSCGAP